MIAGQTITHGERVNFDMVSSGPGRQGSRWRRMQALTMANAEANNAPCVLCRQPIDYELTRAMPLNRLAGTVHHLTGLAQGGDPLDPANLAPAHRGCNTRHSNRLRWHTPRLVPLTSRRW